MTDYFARQNQSYTAFLRNPALAPAKAFPNAVAVCAFEIGGEMDMQVFEGITTVLLATSATKPNMRFNGLINEVQKNVLPHCQFVTDLCQTDVKHLIYLSSGGAIYGDCDTGAPITEDFSRQPCTPYGYGKLCIEAAIQNIWVGGGRRFTIMRPSNPVGPHQMQSIDMHGLVTTVFHNIQKGQTVNIFGDGGTIRDYFSVYDLAELILVVSRNTVAENRTINASSGRGLSVSQVVKICAETLGRSPKVRYVPEKQPRINYNVLSNNLAKSLYNWNPKLTMDKIVQDLENHQRMPTK